MLLSPLRKILKLPVRSIGLCGHVLPRLLTQRPALPHPSRLRDPTMWLSCPPVHPSMAGVDCVQEAQGQHL